MIHNWVGSYWMSVSKNETKSKRFKRNAKLLIWESERVPKCVKCWPNGLIISSRLIWAAEFCCVFYDRIPRSQTSMIACTNRKFVSMCEDNTLKLKHTHTQTQSEHYYWKWEKKTVRQTTHARAIGVNNEIWTICAWERKRENKGNKVEPVDFW